MGSLVNINTSHNAICTINIALNIRKAIQENHGSANVNNGQDKRNGQSFIINQAGILSLKSIKY
jgi:hypothetical protein